MGKATLRCVLRRRRLEYAKQYASVMNHQLFQLFLQSNLLQEKATIGGYHAVKGEVNPRAIIEYYQGKGHRCCMPVVCFGTTVLQFREIYHDTIMEDNGQGIAFPASGPEILPDIILVPMLGFDHQGQRLGQGGGHYDATIDYFRSFHHCVAVGLAFDCQEVEELPRELHDQAMDYIITPSRILSFV